MVRPEKNNAQKAFKNKRFLKTRMPGAERFRKILLKQKVSEPSLPEKNNGKNKNAAGTMKTIGKPCVFQHSRARAKKQIMPLNGLNPRKTLVLQTNVPGTK